MSEIFKNDKNEIENNTNEINVPEAYGRQKLNSLYRAIPLKDTTFRLLRKYFCAMSRLYGILPLSKAKEIIFSQNPGLVTDEEFAAFCEVARHENEMYYILSADELYIDGKPGGILDCELINDIVVDAYNDDDFANLKEMQRGKPYYIPEKKEFLKYADPLYVGEMPERDRLDDFLRNTVKMDVKLIDDFIVIITETDAGNFNDVLSVFKDLNYELSKKQIDKFVRIYSDFMNNIRIPENRGFTPIEMSKKLPKGETSVSFGDHMKDMLKSGELDAEGLRQSLISTDELPDELRFDLLKQLNDIAPVRKNEKIGRNELCPCGSGKKYKKCCGR